MSTSLRALLAAIFVLTAVPVFTQLDSHGPLVSLPAAGGYVSQKLAGWNPSSSSRTYRPVQKVLLAAPTPTPSRRAERRRRSGDAAIAYVLVLLAFATLYRMTRNRLPRT